MIPSVCTHEPSPPASISASRGEGFSNRDGKVGGPGAGGRRKVGGHEIFVCAVVAVLVALDHWSNVGNVYRNVEVGGVALGGKAPAEARRMLEEGAALAPEEIRLTGSGGGFALSRDEVGIHLRLRR